MPSQTVSHVSGHQDFVGSGTEPAFRITAVPRQSDSNFDPVVSLETEDFQGVVLIGSISGDSSILCRVLQLDGTPPAIGQNFTLHFAFTHVSTAA